MSLTSSPSSAGRVQSSADRLAAAVLLDQQLQQQPPCTPKRNEQPQQDSWATGMVSVEKSLDEKTTSDMDNLLAELKQNASSKQQRPSAMDAASSLSERPHINSALIDRLPSYLRETRAAKRSSHVSSVVRDFSADHPQLAGIMNSVSSIYEEMITMLIDDIDRKDRLLIQNQCALPDAFKVDANEDRRSASITSQLDALKQTSSSHSTLRVGSDQQQLNSLFSIHPSGALNSLSHQPAGLGHNSTSSRGRSLTAYNDSATAAALSSNNTQGITFSNTSSNSNLNGSQLRDRGIAKMQRETRRVLLSAMKIKYKLGNVIGTGTHGIVYLALLENTGETVAAKEISFSQQDPKWERRLNELQKEVGVLKKIEHEHVVQYLFTEKRMNKSNPTMLIFMEYVSGGSIASIVQQFGALHDSTVAIFAAQITLALRHLHRNGIVHRDIKPANCLLSPFGIVKVADFGTALTEDDEVADAEVPLSMAGTPYFMAPEVIRQERYSSAVDAWSLGCTVMEMLTGAAPWAHLGFKTPIAVMHYVAEETEEAVTLPKGISPDAADFLRLCLQRVPTRRPSMHDLLRHRWFHQHDVLMLSYDMNDLALRPEKVENIGMQIASTSSVNNMPLPPRSRNNAEPRAATSLSEPPLGMMNKD